MGQIYSSSSSELVELIDFMHDETNLVTIITNKQYEKILQYKNINWIKLMEFLIIDQVKQFFALDDVIIHLIDNVNNLEMPGGPNNIYLINLICIHSNTKVIKYIIDKGVRLNVSDNTGRNPLMYLCMRGNLEMFKYVIENKMNELNLNNWDNEGRQLIHYVCKSSNVEMLKCIISKNVDLESEDKKGLRPIHYACKYSNLEMLKCIISKNVNLESEDKKGWRPIHYVAKYSDSNMLEFMINKGVKLDTKTNNGDTVIDFIKVN